MGIKEKTILSCIHRNANTSVFSNILNWTLYASLTFSCYFSEKITPMQTNIAAYIFSLIKEFSMKHQIISSIFGRFLHLFIIKESHYQWKYKLQNEAQLELQLICEFVYKSFVDFSSNNGQFSCIILLKFVSPCGKLKTCLFFVSRPVLPVVVRGVIFISSLLRLFSLSKLSGECDTIFLYLHSTQSALRGSTQKTPPKAVNKSKKTAFDGWSTDVLKGSINIDELPQIFPRHIVLLRLSLMSAFCCKLSI